jgi:predicted dehydrogenase
MKENNDNTEKATGSPFSRRSFLNSIGLGSLALGLQAVGCSPAKNTAATAGGNSKIAGFEQEVKADDIHKGWTPVSDRKVKVGLVGYGLCKFAAAFQFQVHPNVEVVAVSDLFPDRCTELAKAARCNKTYPSLEEMVKDKSIEAIFVATDAPSHAKHAILALEHGKHVAVAVPAVFGSLELADKLYETVKRSGKRYMLFETSCFHADLYAMRKIYQAGGFGNILYSEGEYIHYQKTPLASYKGWRNGSPPMYYLTHGSAYYAGVTNKAFTDVSCVGTLGKLEYLKNGNNPYKNPFGTQVATFNTTEGGVSRMMGSKEIVGWGSEGGRIRGEKGSFADKYVGEMKTLPNTKRPPLPPTMTGGSHGGSHGHLTEEFIRAILEDRHPWIDVAMALNISVPGIVGHQSCLKGGETLKIPQYKMWA